MPPALAHVHVRLWNVLSEVHFPVDFPPCSAAAYQISCPLHGTGLLDAAE